MPEDLPNLPELSAVLLRALDAGGIGLVVTRDPGHGELERVYSSVVAARLLGYTAQEMDLIPPMLSLTAEEKERLSRLRAAINRGETEMPTRLDTVVQRPDGSCVPISVAFGHLESGGLRHVVSFLQDRREQLAAGQALRDSEQRFRLLIDASPDAITIVSDGRFAYANRAAADQFGYGSVEELLAQPMAALMHPAEMARMAERVPRLMAGERLPPAEYAGICKDGSLAFVEVVSVPFVHEGQPAVLGFARDIRERKRMQADLIRADRMAAVGTLAAGVAHEINNPLTYVLLHLERLRRELPALVTDPARRAESARMLDEALEGGERVRTIVRDLLAFSRSETVDRELVDVALVIQSTIKLAAASIHNRARVALALEDVPLIESSRARIGQVLLNLVINASQAFVKDDPVENRVDVGLRKVGDQLALSVRDNGPGVPPADMANLFDAFYTTKPGGTGLGLTITRSIVEQLGGTITAANLDAGGMEFEVRMPLRSPASDLDEPPAAAAAAAAAAPVVRRRLVVVDDEERLAVSISALLAEDHDVELFRSSRAALEHLVIAPVDLVLCDLMMADLGGLELYAEACASRPELAGRFVFMSGGAPPLAVRAAVAAGECELLAKPFDVAQMRDVLARKLSA